MVWCLDDPSLSLVNKNERCTVKCPRFRNVTLTYNIKPVYPWSQEVNYNVLCTGCDPDLAGIKNQIQLQVIHCMGGDYDNRFYEIEAATEDGRKGYSTVFVEAECKVSSLFLAKNCFNFQIMFKYLTFKIILY